MLNLSPAVAVRSPEGIRQPTDNQAELPDHLFCQLNHFLTDLNIPCYLARCQEQNKMSTKKMRTTKSIVILYRDGDGIKA